MDNSGGETMTIAAPVNLAVDTAIDMAEEISLLEIKVPDVYSSDYIEEADLLGRGEHADNFNVSEGVLAKDESADDMTLELEDVREKIAEEIEQEEEEVIDSDAKLRDQIASIEKIIIVLSVELDELKESRGGKILRAINKLFVYFFKDTFSSKPVDAPIETVEDRQKDVRINELELEIEGHERERDKLLSQLGVDDSN